MKITIKLSMLLTFLFSNVAFAQDPNIVLIIADDMGWSQVSTGLTNLNNPSDFYETPTLETLASEGIAFPYAYVNGANCAPTRAAILSGQYAARPDNNVFNVTNLNRGNTSSNSTLIGPDMGLASNGNIDEIPASAITIAETMKTAGYTTAHFGKYHVGEDEASSTSGNDPTDQGFDYNYGGGTAGAPGSYFASSSAPYNFSSSIGPELDQFASPYTAAESLLLAGNNSLEGTKKHVNDAMADAALQFMEAEKNTAFFMHFSNYAIHGPFDTGNARPDLLAKYQAKTPSSIGHNSIGQAAIAEGMDQTIGRIVNYLKTTDDPRSPGNKLSENTLVYFISDNGGAISSDDAGPLRGMKGEYYEGGIRSVTLAWSEASWLANKGTVNTTPIIAFDLYPTFVEAASGNLPSNYDIDGASQWQMLTNGSSINREAIFWHFPGYLIDSKRDSRPVTVVRKGDYKLRYNYESLSYELYNLISDIGETNNLLSVSPDQATLIIGNDLSTLLRNHLIDTSAPLPTYRSDGTTVPLPYIIDIDGGIPNSTDGCQATSGYAAYWDFDLASSANDASGNGNDPNPLNGVLAYDAVDFVEGDQSAVFDGTVDINYSSLTFMSPALSARSVVTWIKPTALVGIQEIFDEGGSDKGIAMRLNGSNLESVVRSTVSLADNLSAPFPNDGAWHHVALVYDGVNTSHKLFIDGIEVAASILAPSSLDSHNETGGGIGGVIGNWDSFVNASDSYFTGKMDAFSVYDSVLSDTDVNSAACLSTGGNSTAGCQATSAYEAYWDFDTANSVIGGDISGNAHDPLAIVGVITGDTSDFKEGDQSAVFNGSSSINYALSSAGTFMISAHNTRSVMAWIKPANLTGLQNIFDEGGKSIGIALRLNGATLESIVRENATTAVQLNSAFPNDGGWHHVALVYDGANTSQYLYIDGVEVASGSAAAAIGNHTGKGGIGGKISGFDSFSNNSAAFFTGKMDAFAVYDVVLSAAEVEEGSCLSGPDPVVANAGVDVTICEGSSTILTATGGTSYTWNTGANTASITVSPSATTSYSVTVTDGITSDTDAVEVTVNALPTANAGSDVTIIIGNSTTLTATGGGTYLWNTGETTASITVSPASTTTYSVTVTQNGCETTDDVQVTVNPLAVVANAGVDVTICEGSSTTLTASGGTSYTWNTGATTESITVSPSATTTYSVTVTDGMTSDTDAVEVTVNALPAANAGSDVVIIIGNSTIITATGGGTYLWNTGATTASITVNPASTTSYSVTVTQNGCETTDDVQVTVNPLAVVANAGADVAICEGSSTTLTASGGTSYTWNTGETTASITVSPSATTSYSVTVTDGMTSDTDAVEVIVNALPTANAGSDVIIIIGNSTTLTATGGGTYLWNTGETTASIAVSPASTTSYSVTVTQNGCETTDDVQVTVNPLAVVANAGADVAICEGSSTILTASGGTSYTWNTGETTASIAVSPSATTSYSVTVTDGMTSDTDAVEVIVNALPTANAGSDVTIIIGNSTTLTATGGGTYLWNTGETAASITVNPASTASYSVTVTQNGCETTDDVQVTVNSLAVVANAGVDVAICEGSSTTLTASGGTSYTWNTGATTASITVSPSATTSYSVTVTDGMTSDTDAVEVTVNALPTANAGLDVTIDEGNSITLTASGGGTYLWNTGATSSSITVSPTTNTTYSVTVSQNGCSSVLDDVTVTVNSVGCSYSVLNSEGFESGWGIWNDGGVDSRRSANDANYASTGIYCVRLRDDNSTSTMTTDDLDLTSYEEITINFGYYARSMDNSNEDFWLQISNTGGASFTIIEEWNLNDEFVNNQFYTDQVIIPGPFNSNTQFRFRADGSGNSDWIYIDDVVISGCSNGGAARIVANKKEVLATIEPDFGADAVSTSLYPNPFNSEMTLKIEGNYEKADVRIFNVLGQSLYFKSFNNKEIIQISTDNFQNGQYLIRMDIDGITTYKRAIKD